MATLTGTTIAGSYKDLLKIAEASKQAGLDTTLRAVEDGDATASALNLSTTSASIGHTVTTSDAGSKALFIDANTSGVAAQDSTGLHIDFDRTVAGSGTAAHNDIGIDLDVNSASLGTSSLVGMDIDVVGAASGTSTATGLAVTVGSADTNYAAVFSGGNVGIGTASPSALLTLESSTASKPEFRIENTNADGNAPRMYFVKDSSSPAATDDLGIIRFYGDNASNAETNFADIVGTASDVTAGAEIASLRFRVNSAGTITDRMVIKGGNVGIGTAAPGSMLDIKEADSNSVQETLRILDSDGTKQIVFNTTPGDGAYTQYFADDGSTVSTRIGGGYSTLNTYFNNGGNVGIGIAAPEGALNISSTLDADTDFSDGQYYHLHLHNPTDTNGLDCGIGFGISTTVDSVGASIVHERKGSDSYGDLVFGTKPSGGAVTERMRIASGGDVAISGDLIMADGKGIDFAAYTDGSVAGSTTSQTLKDYEEGTWSPVLTDGSNDASMHGNTAGTYTKVGRMVTIWAYVQTSNLGSASGAISIKGLPFTQATTDAHGAGTWGYGNAMAISAGTNITGMVGSSTAIMSIRHWDVAGGTSALQASEWSSDADCSFTCSYIT